MSVPKHPELEPNRSMAARHGGTEGVRGSRRLEVGQASNLRSRTTAKKIPRGIGTHAAHLRTSVYKGRRWWLKAKGCAMKADVVQKAESADKQLEQAGKSTMRVGAILFLVGAGMTALISLTNASESQTRDIGSSIFLVALVLGALRFLRGYRQYQQGRRLAARGRPPG